MPGKTKIPHEHANKNYGVIGVIINHPIISAIITAILVLCLGMAAVMGAVWWQLRTTADSGGGIA